MVRLWVEVSVIDHVACDRVHPAIWHTETIDLEIWGVWYVYYSLPYFLVSVCSVEDDIPLAVFEMGEGSNVPLITKVRFSRVREYEARTTGTLDLVQEGRRLER